MSVASSREVELKRVALFRTELRRFLVRHELASKEAGLTPQRYDLLLMVEASGKAGLRVTELCGLLEMKQTGVSELVRRAVASGLLERRSSPQDGRVRVLTTTAKGRRQLYQVFDALRDDRAALALRFKELGAQFKASSA